MPIVSKAYAAGPTRSIAIPRPAAASCAVRRPQEARQGVARRGRARPRGGAGQPEAGDEAHERARDEPGDLAPELVVEEAQQARRTAESPAAASTTRAATIRCADRAEDPAEAVV